MSDDIRCFLALPFFIAAMLFVGVVAVAVTIGMCMAQTSYWIRHGEFAEDEDENEPG